MLRRITTVRPAPSRQRGEEGWALLGLLLALGVMAIVLASSVVPNVQMQVQRDKELEMLYRGEQISQGIARYYNNGALRGINLLQRPPYGYLLELARLRDGVTIGVNERKFIRPSALIDPISNAEWEPVRARDPRIMPFLQAWAAQTLVPIPNQYLLIAGPPTRSVFGRSESPTDPAQRPLTPGQTGPQTGPQAPPIANPANPGTPPGRPGQDSDPDDDDDDFEIPDPLASLFDLSGPGLGSTPIVGVAPKRKGKATNTYFGLSNYDEWVFLFIPLTQQQGGPPLPVPPGQQVRPPQVSQ